MIQERIQQDQIQALKSGDKQKLEMLRYILAQLKYAQIEKKGELTDDDVVQVLRKQIKEIHESVDGFKNGGRTDLVEENEQKLAILQEYMPAEMSDDELRQELKNVIDANKDTYDTKRKAIIGIAVKELKSKVDPARISTMLATEFDV
jgi:hypothetical protein